MAGRSLHAYVFVACTNASREGPAGHKTPRTLEGVSHVYGVPAAVEFPYEADFWFYLRLAYSGRVPSAKSLRLKLVWLDAPKGPREVWDRDFQGVKFRAGVTIKNLAVPVNCLFEGAGRYEFQVWYNVRREWESEGRPRLVARTYLELEV